MATPANLGPGAPVVQPNWFTRNWKWALPLGIIFLFLFFLSFVAGVFLLVETSFQHSGSYQQALDRARQSPQVAAKIGHPVKAGWLASGSVNTSGPTGDADLSIPISGPKGKGTLYVVAKKKADLWTFETLQIEVEGEGERIDLLKPEGSNAGPS